MGRLHRLRTGGQPPGPAISRQLFALLLEGALPDELQEEIHQMDDGFALAKPGVWPTADAERALTALLARFCDYGPSKATAA